MGYNASVTANCWKVHTCVHCSTVFRYYMTRKVTAQGNTEDGARTNLGKAVVASLTTGVDPYCCPTCGLMPPEMVTAARNSRYGCLNWMTIGVGACLMIALGVEFPVSTVIFWGVILLGILAAVFALTALKNPNANVQGNLTTAQKEVQEQKLFIEEKPENPPVRSSSLGEVTHGGHPLALGLLCAGLFLLALPETMRVVSGWRANESFFPAVVGPGDTPTYYFHRGISSIKGYWKGRVKAEMSGAGLSAPKELQSETKDNNWGDSISVKSSEKDSSETLWAKVVIPNETALASKDAKVHLKVEYVAPVMSGSNNFREEAGTVEESPDLHLSSPGAGSLYGKLAWWGVVGGSGLILMAGYLLVRHAKSLKGNPHHALQAED